MVDIIRALNTPGWMRPEELTWLAEQAQTHSRIAEMGSHLGRSTRALAEHTPGKVFAIDDWSGHSEFVGNIPPVVLFGAFCENILDLINDGKVKIVKIDHVKVTDVDEFIFARSVDMIDMVFIDGEHAYTSITRDIKNWLSMIPKGALICGHDYDWHDVKVAVDEWVPGRQFVPNTSLWWWVVE